MLICPSCRRVTVDSLAQRVELLKRRGKLLRDKQPDPAIVDQLLRAELPNLTCQYCGHVGLVLPSASRPVNGDASGNNAGGLDDAELDAEQWGEARRCIGCGIVIDPERLEVLPETRQCTACSRIGKTSREDPREFCDRCGAELQLSQRRGSGLAGYVMKCTACN